MKHLQLFENWLNESSNWQDMIMSACSDFEEKHPGGLEKLLASDADSIMNSEELQDLYNEAAMCVIEPNVALNRHEVNMDSFYDKSEREGLGFIAPVLRERPDGDKWVLFLDLIEELGY